LTVLDFNTARLQHEISKHGFDRDDIRNRLHDNPRAFIEWLYGGRAYFTKTDARIGNVEGEAGSSLSIDLRSGLWKDHSTNEGGDLIGLYRAWRGYGSDDTFVLSLKEIARDYLGDSTIELERTSWTKSPRERIEQQKAKLGDKPRQENVDLGAPVGEWKYYDLHGKIVASVVRYEPAGTPASKTYRPWCFKNVDGQEKWVMGAPTIRPLLYLSEVATASTVVLVEGEKCADALRSLGIVATTAMQGAKAPIEKTDWAPLAGKRVIIWPDNDEPGMDYARKAAAKLQALGCTVLGVTPPADAPPKWDAADCIADGGNAHALIEGAAPVHDQTRDRMRLFRLSEMEAMRPPEFLVHDAITVNGLSMIWGASGSMKTFVALDIALSVATGMDWHSRPVKRGCVVYVAAEGSHGVRKRAEGWWKTRGRNCRPEPDFHMLPVPVAITVKTEIDAMLASVLALEVRPSLIILDTLARTFGGGNENTQEDMNAYVNALDRLRLATGAHVMVIHHSGVTDTNRERGSNVLRAAADTVIKVSRKGEKIELVNTSPAGKQKDFEEFPTVKLRAVKTSFIAFDGEEVETIVLNEREDDEDDIRKDDEEAAEDSSHTKSQRAARPRGRNQVKIMEVLKATNGRAMNRGELMAKSGVGRNSFSNTIGALVRANLVERSYDITTNEAVWRLAGT
jgi:AAA domain